MQLSQYHLEWMTCNNPDLIWTERNEILMIQYLNVLITLHRPNRHLQYTCLVDQRGHFHPHYVPQTITPISNRYLPRTISPPLHVLLLHAPILHRHDQRISTAMCADIAVFHLIGMICSFVGNDKTRLNTIMWIVWALAFLGVSVVGPSQIQTKPPTVQPASSPTPVILSVNNQKITRKLPHSQYIRSINHNTSRPPTSGHYLQSKLLSEHPSRKVQKYPSVS
ncbi:hypothetical protein BLNAU_15074 [Blattamonas nauphoetae]|uniref:Uncharacterized protein n=1 Tax=Blattamonas nauphoetae TaxID=2049346 RepID=A0ABQ9XF47_9EUKA|nr:hypothetical protein BLNAU_15074 [Blattamonas nauphoetae]